jgi:alanine racemase
VTPAHPPLLRPTYAEINLSALGRNLKKARALAAAKCKLNPKIMLLVKAEAYGHGALAVAMYAQKNKLAQALGAASVEEGIYLRQNGVKLPILILGSVYPFEGFEYALKNNLSVTIASARAAKYVAALAAKLKIKAKAHVKQETGLNRIGSRKPAALEILKILNAAPYVKVEGVYSHIAAADNKASVKKQLEYFKDFLSQAAALNLKTGMAHIAASPSFLKYGGICFDMLRLGHLAYGLDKGFEPALALKSKVVFIKDVRAGVGVSYGGVFKTKKPSKIATIPIGYGDGYHRLLSGKANVLIKGKKCPVVGNITMDMLTADITKLGDIPVGSEAVLIGRQGKAQITAAEVAAQAQTIDYEVVTAISARVPRVIK